MEEPAPLRFLVIAAVLLAAALGAALPVCAQASAPPQERAIADADRRAEVARLCGTAYREEQAGRFDAALDGYTQSLLLAYRTENAADKQTSCYHLMLFYRNGWNTRRDAEKAIFWGRQADEVARTMMRDADGATQDEALRKFDEGFRVFNKTLDVLAELFAGQKRTQEIALVKASRIAAWQAFNSLARDRSTPANCFVEPGLSLYLPGASTQYEQGERFRDAARHWANSAGTVNDLREKKRTAGDAWQNRDEAGLANAEADFATVRKTIMAWVVSPQ